MDRNKKESNSQHTKKPKMKSKWAKREARLKKVKEEENEMSELDQRILDVSLRFKNRKDFLLRPSTVAQYGP